MKMLVVSLLAFTYTAAAQIGPTEPMKPHHLSARPIEIASLNKDDRKFLTDVGAEMLLQSTAARTVLDVTENGHFSESAQYTLTTLKEIQADLEELAKVKGVALPLEGSIEKPGDFNRFMNSRNGAFEREYQRYADRSTARLHDRFSEAAKNADDAEVRAFAMRHVKWIYSAHRETKGLASSADLPSGSR